MSDTATTSQVNLEKGDGSATSIKLPMDEEAAFQRLLKWDLKDLLPAQERSVKFSCALFWFEIVAVVILFAIFPTWGDFWGKFDTFVRCGEYCERRDLCNIPINDRDSVMEPLNSYSNLAYVFQSLTPITVLLSTNSKITRDLRVLCWTHIITSSVILSLGSFAWHASGAYIGGLLDVAGMRSVLASLTAFGVPATFPKTFKEKPWAIWVLVTGVIGVTCWNGLTAVPTVFAGVVTSGIFGSWYAYNHPERRSEIGKVAAIASALMLLATLARALDIADIACDPQSWLYQGHMWWHLLTNVAIHMVVTLLISFY